MVSRWSVSRCPTLLSGAVLSGLGMSTLALSSLTMSTLAIWCVPRCQVSWCTFSRFQRPHWYDVVCFRKGVVLCALPSFSLRGHSTWSWCLTLCVDTVRSLKYRHACHLHGLLLTVASYSFLGICDFGGMKFWTQLFAMYNRKMPKTWPLTEFNFIAFFLILGPWNTAQNIDWLCRV